MTETAADADVPRRDGAQYEASTDQAERCLRAIHAVSRVLGEETALDSAMPRILAALGPAFHAKLAAFWMPTGSTLEVRSMWTAEPYESALWEQLCRRHRFGAGSGLPGRTWRDRRVTWFPAIVDDTSMPRQEGLAKLRVKSGIGFPLMIRDNVVGVIELFTARIDAPDDQVVDALRLIGSQLGQFLQQVRTQDQLREQIEQQHLLARASHLFAGSLEVDAILGELANLAVPWLGDWCTVHTIERDGSYRLAAVNYGEVGLADRVHALVDNFQPNPTQTDGMYAAIKTRKTQFVAQVTEELLQRQAKDANHLEALRDVAVGSYVVVPMVARGNALGAITIASASPRKFSGNDVALIEEVSSRASLATANAQLYAEAHTTALELAVERETLTRLNEIGPTLTAELDLGALVQSVTETATQLTGAQFGAFYVSPTTPGESFSLSAVAGITREAFGKLPKTGLFAPVFDSRGVVSIDDVAADPRHARHAISRSMIDGHLTIRSYLSVPVTTRAGAIIGGLVFAHERPKMFSERAQRIAMGLAANAATAMDNARLYTDAQRLIKELEKTNAELDQFAYVASHDLRAPLRGISNLAMWVEEDLGESAPPSTVEQLRLLKGRAARMDKLINGLLELARVGRTRQKPERVDVTELLHETIDLLSPPEAARVLIVGAMPTLYAERFALQQVFLNLVTNALQHSERPDVVVRITATEHADHCELAVADNGVGIAPEHHARVWQIFQTLQSRDVTETTGIGLTIVKKQVEANGGRAWIDDTVREGATLRFTWPLRAK